MARNYFVGRRFRIAALGSVAALALYPTVASAQGARTSEVNMKAQNLGDALTQAGLQTRTEIIFSPTAVAGKTAPAVQGNLSAQETVARILAGSGLYARQTKSGAFVVEVTPQGNASAGVPNAGNKENASSKGEENTERGTQNDPVNDKAILVTGTRFKGANPSVPVKVYTAQRIEESGTTTAAAFLNTLPEVSVQSTPDRFSATGGQTKVRIHGFPAGTTATLLNGRRLVPSADTSTDFDLNTLPLAFIERIDVLPSGSSAIYGSDAIAGVVNFITKRDVSGLHLRAGLGHAAQYTEQNYSLGWGKAWDRGALSVFASYDTNDRLLGRDREIIANADYSRFARQGGQDMRFSICDPGNVFSTTGGNLPGLGAPVAAIRPGVTGAPAPADFIAGSQNLCSLFKDVSLIPAIKRAGILVTGRIQVTSSIEAFAELLYTHTRTSAVFPLTPLNASVPASNAFNPFGVPVSVQTKLAVQSFNLSTKDYFRPLVGLRGNLFSDWTWEVGLWRSQDRSPLRELGVTQPAALAAALASSDPSTALNPFSSQDPGSPALLATVYPTRTNSFKFDVNVVDDVLRGRLFDLPAGPVKFVIGSEYQWQHFRNDASAVGGKVTDVGRNVGAVYSELRAPILSSHDGDGDLLDVTAAARYDRYNDFGGKATPQVGIELRPTQGLLVRGSYARAFKAPQLTQLYAAQRSFIAGPFADNGRPGDPIASNVVIFAGGNRNLQAETGDAYSLGGVWSSDKTSGFVASLDYWWLAENNRISTPSVAEILANPGVFPGRAVRDANGILVSVDTTATNFGGLRAEGFDLNVTKLFRTSWGDLTAGLDWVMTTKLKASESPSAPLQNRLGQATLGDAWAVRNKATFSLGWTEGRYSLYASGRYIGSYRDYVTDPPNNNRLGNFALFDLSGRIKLGGIANQEHLGAVALIASVVNVFNTGPQYSNFQSGVVGYDPQESDILGRVVRAGLIWDW